MSLKQPKFFYHRSYRLLSFLILFTWLFQSGALFAQDGRDIVEESMMDMKIVAGAGAAGAILGLSTLSFAEHPKTRVKNIIIGASLGVIAGVAVVVYRQATYTQTRMQDQRMGEEIHEGNFLYEGRMSYHAEESARWQSERFVAHHANPLPFTPFQLFLTF